MDTVGMACASVESRKPEFCAARRPKPSDGNHGDGEEQRMQCRPGAAGGAGGGDGISIRLGHGRLRKLAFCAGGV